MRRADAEADEEGQAQRQRTRRRGGFRRAQAAADRHDDVRGARADTGLKFLRPGTGEHEIEPAEARPQHFRVGLRRGARASITGGEAEMLRRGADQRAKFPDGEAFDAVEGQGRLRCRIVQDMADQGDASPAGGEAPGPAIGAPAQRRERQEMIFELPDGGVIARGLVGGADDFDYAADDRLGLDRRPQDRAGRPQRARQAHFADAGRDVDLQGEPADRKGEIVCGLVFVGGRDEIGLEASGQQRQLMASSGRRRTDHGREQEGGLSLRVEAQQLDRRRAGKRV